MTRESLSAWRARQKATEQSVDAAVAAVKAEQDAAWADARETARAAAATHHRFTVDEIRGTRAVRTATGWHRVVRVNSKSVTVETPWSWTDRIPIDKILEIV